MHLRASSQRQQKPSHTAALALGGAAETAQVPLIEQSLMPFQLNTCLPAARAGLLQCAGQ